MSIVKAIAFLINDKSVVVEGNLATSWFSKNDPRRVVSEQVDFMVLIPLTRFEILPPVFSNASLIQK